ncbi:glycosyltransferase family 4 protein [Candidatus Berkelbacteria bacterium]|nr:glycosyltransferase family 4 protein [Candidatus Berkelbacteria bacterium]
MARSQRITLVTSTFLPRSVGGAEIQVHLLASFLVGQGWDVEVVTGSAVRPKDVPYRVTSLPALRVRPSLVYEPWWARRTAQKIQTAIDPSRIVHSFDVLSRGVVAELGYPRTITTIQDISPICGTIDGLLVDGSVCTGCTAANLLQHRRLARYHGVAWLGRVIRYWTACVLPYRRRLLTKYGAVTVLTEFLRSYLHLEAALVIPDLVPMPSEPGLEQPPQAPTLISVGRLGFEKGTDLVIRSLAELPDFLALLVGGGAREHCQQRARQLGVADRIEFAGAVPPAQVSAWYRRADVVVQASRGAEASSRTILEGMSHGKAVVGPDFGGPAELIEDRVNGVRFARGSVPELVRAIRTAYAERERLGAQARRTSERYQPDVVGPAYLALYEQL